jgi:tRNA-dihydrouridine synthase
MVRAVAEGCAVPIFVKIRLLPDLADTLTFCKVGPLISLRSLLELLSLTISILYTLLALTCRFVPQGLQEAGASLIAVHGRYRGSPTHPRDGPAKLVQVPYLSSIRILVSLLILM